MARVSAVLILAGHVLVSAAWLLLVISAANRAAWLLSGALVLTHVATGLVTAHALASTRLCGGAAIWGSILHALALAPVVFYAVTLAQAIIVPDGLTQSPVVRQQIGLIWLQEREIAITALVALTLQAGAHLAGILQQLPPDAASLVHSILSGFWLVSNMFAHDRAVWFTSGALVLSHVATGWVLAQPAVARPAATRQRDVHSALLKTSALALFPVALYVASLVMAILRPAAPATLAARTIAGTLWADERWEVIVAFCALGATGALHVTSLIVSALALKTHQA